MWVYPVESSAMGKGPLLVTPISLDLAMIVDTFNGHWDRDNVGAAGMYSASTFESPFASKVSYAQAAAATSDFTQTNDGRYMLTNMDQTVTTLDAELVIDALSNVRIQHNAGAAGVLPLFVGMGVEVDGRIAYHTGYELIRVDINGAYGVELSFAFEVGVPVGAGSHKVRMFYDFVRGVPTTNAANCTLDACRQLETFLMCEEVRR